VDRRTWLRASAIDQLSRVSIWPEARSDEAARRFRAHDKAAAQSRAVISALALGPVYPGHPTLAARSPAPCLIPSASLDNDALYFRRRCFRKCIPACSNQGASHINCLRVIGLRRRVLQQTSTINLRRVASREDHHSPMVFPYAGLSGPTNRRSYGFRKATSEKRRWQTHQERRSKWVRAQI
jgi:hypothetical protein